MTADIGSRKMMMIITHAQDNTEKANLSLALAASMVSEDYDLVILFMFDGAFLAKKGAIETIEDGAVTPGRELLPILRETKVPMFVCSPCAVKRGIGEADLEEGIKVISGPTAVTMMPGRQILKI